MNCTVHVRKDACEVLVGTRVIARAQEAAKAAGLPLDKVPVHNHVIGGGFRPALGDGVARGRNRNVAVKSGRRQREAIVAWWRGEGGEGAARARLADLSLPVLVAKVRANGVTNVMIHAEHSFAIAQKAPKLIFYPDTGHAFVFQYAEDLTQKHKDFYALSSSCSQIHPPRHHLRNDQVGSISAVQAPESEGGGSPTSDASGIVVVHLLGHGGSCGLGPSRGSLETT
jgi:hypothetical protein